MNNLSILRNYQQFKHFLEAAELDDIKDSIEEFLNVTKLTDDNIAVGSVEGDKLADDVVGNVTITFNPDHSLLTIKDASLTSTSFTPNSLGSHAMGSHALRLDQLALRSPGSTSIGRICLTPSFTYINQYGTLSQGFYTESTTFTQVASVSFTHGPRPINIGVALPDYQASETGFWSIGALSSGIQRQGEWQIQKNGVPLDTRYFGSSLVGQTAPSLAISLANIKTIDLSCVAGTDVYSLWARVVTPPCGIDVAGKLLVYEE